MVQPIFNTEEKILLTQAIEAAETNTRAEIVPVVVRTSDTYPGARWRLAVVVMLISTAALTWLLPNITPELLLALLLPLLLLGHLLATRPWLVRLALSQQEIAEEVKQRATQAFIENNLQQTRERTGVLIFVSLLERRIEVLADTGIDSQAPENFWDEVVAELGQSIRQGQLAQGLTQAIKRCGDLLETQAPARSDDRNELPDRVIVEK